MYNKILTLPPSLSLSSLPQDSYISIYMVSWHGVIFQKEELSLFFVSLNLLLLISSLNTHPCPFLLHLSTFVLNFLFPNYRTPLLHHN